MLSNALGEALAQRALASRGKRDDPRVLLATRPVECQAAAENCRADRAGEMIAAHAPVETRPA